MVRMPDESQPPPPKNSVPKNPSMWAEFAKYSHLAFVLPAAVFGGWLLGSWIDRSSGKDYFYLVGIGLGVFAGFYELIRSVIRMSKEK